MDTRTFQTIIIAAATLGISFIASAEGNKAKPTWQEEFGISKCNLVTTGRNPYFIMEPGFQLALESEDTKLHITVLDDTKQIDGVLTRVVEEREWKDGNLHEVARNYFAMCEQTKDVFYFGEDVDYYVDGKVTKHDGTWHAGENGNKAGLIMPGTPKPKMKYYQEMAPGIAMDRAEIVSMSEICKTTAGTFSKCMKVKEGTAIDITAREYKYHAPDIGLIRDDDLKLVKYGFVKN